jgi:hypothetical protein
MSYQPILCHVPSVIASYPCTRRVVRSLSYRVANATELGFDSLDLNTYLLGRCLTCGAQLAYLLLLFHLEDSNVRHTKIISFVQLSRGNCKQFRIWFYSSVSLIWSNTGLIRNAQLTLKSLQGSYITLAVWFVRPMPQSALIRTSPQLLSDRVCVLSPHGLASPFCWDAVLKLEILWEFHPAVLGLPLTHQ